MTDTAVDSDIIYGLVARQQNMISDEQLKAALEVWVRDRNQPLAEILKQQKALTEAGHTLVESQIIEQHSICDENSTKVMTEISTDHLDRKNIKELINHFESTLQVSSPFDEEQRNHTLEIISTIKAIDLQFDRVGQEPTVEDSISRVERVGDMVSRFKIERAHAKGGLGEVFIAIDQEVPREVALKSIRDSHARIKNSCDRFVREAEITGSLEHPGIVPVYGIGKYQDGRPYYAMRFIRGDSLADGIEEYHAKKSERSESELAIVRQQYLNRFIDVCNAIGYAHSRGVIHRDIKPDNIMLGKYGETLVVDWGLAKLIKKDEPQSKEDDDIDEGLVLLKSHGQVDATLMGSVLGTPGYMSPEQALGNVEDLGPETDIYSLGATLYTMLTGQASIIESQLDLILDKTIEGNFPRPRELNKTTPRELEAICLKCMAKNPTDRYSTCKEIAADIERYLADEPTSAYPEPIHKKFSRFSKKHAERFVLWTAVIFILFLRLVINNSFASKDRLQTDLKEKNSALVSAEQSRMKYYGRFLDLAQNAMNTMSPNQALQELEKTNPEDRGWEFRFLTNKFSGDNYKLSVNCGVQVNSVDFASNHNYFVNGNQDGTIQIWDGETEERIHTIQVSSAPVLSIDIDPQEKRILSGTEDGVIQLSNPETGKVLKIFKNSSGAVHCVSFDHSGKSFAAGFESGVTKIWNTDSGKELLTLKGKLKDVKSLSFSPNDEWIALGSSAGLISFWKLEDNEEKLTMDEHSGVINSIDWRPDSKSIASASSDGTIVVWDVPCPECNQILKGHTGSVTAIDWTSDGNRIVSGSSDQSIKIWDEGSGLELLTIDNLPNEVKSVRFGPEEDMIISVSQRWDSKPFQW